MAKFPFTLESWLKDKSQKVETRDGRSARIICIDAKADDGACIIALIPGYGGEEAYQFFPNGKAFSSKSSVEDCADLFIVTPEPEITEFEQEVSDIVEYCKEHGENVAFDYAKRHARTLLALAREQFIKDGYIIEKKAFHDAVEKVDPEVMKEVSDSVDKENKLAKRHLEGYIKGREDTLRKMRDFIESHFNTQSGTSTATLHGNTSATDGKEHNPSFID